MKKTISILLTLLMLASAAAGCSQSTDNAGEAQSPSSPSAPASEGETVPEETEEPDPFAGRDYNGRSFRINTSANAAEITLQTSNYLIEGPEELTGDAAPDAAFQRNKKVEDFLNLKLEFTQVDLNYAGVAGLLRNYVSTGADDYECFINDIYGSAPITVEGGFHNGLEVESLDFSRPWWYPDFMRDIAMNYNYQYMLAGDFFIDVLRSSHALIYNKNLYTDLFGDGDAMYETVLNGEWTYDRLIEIQEASYADLNGNGQADKGDRYGYVSYQTWGPMIPFLISANPGFVERDEEGYPTITVFNERSLRLTDYLVKVFNSPVSGSLTVFQDDSPATVEAFTTGRAVFIGSQRLGSLEYALFRDMEQEIGVLPYPKMDEGDSYVTSAHDTSEVGLIPITVPYDTLEFVGAAIEVLCRETHREVLPVYYESSLKVKYTRDNTAAQMIDIIHDNIGDSFPLAWSNELSQVLMQATFYNAVVGDGDFASKYKSLEKVSNKQLEKIVEAFRKRTGG